MKKIIIAAVLAATACAASAGSISPDVCASIGNAARSVAVLRDSGKPASVARDLARANMSGQVLNVALATVDVVYEQDWTPTQAKRVITAMCLKTGA